MRNPRFSGLSLAITGAVVIIVVSAALTYRGDYRWVGHAVVGVMALITLSVMATTGRKLAKMRDSRGTALLRQHTAIGIFFAVLVVGTFLYGLPVSLGRDGLLWGNSPHAWLGAAVVVAGLAQLTPSLTLKRTTTVRFYHRILGYTLFALILGQIGLGIYMVLTGT
jgi:heme A synthase